MSAQEVVTSLVGCLRELGHSAAEIRAGLLEAEPPDVPAVARDTLLGMIDAALEATEPVACTIWRR